MPSEKSKEIVAAFQRYLRSGSTEETDTFSLADLRHADEQWGNRDLESDFRIAIRNRIKSLEAEERKIHESRVRTIGYVVSFCVGGLAGYFVSQLSRWSN